jgi:2-oxoglutarate ferredoxin oxidoreductase subunit beta
MAVALALNAPFIARAYAGDIEETKKIIMQAISFRGFSLVDVFQPCVVFNKVNTYQWFKENTRYLPGNHDTSDRTAAFGLAAETDSLPLGVFYRNDDRECYEDLIGVGTTPLYLLHPPDEKAFQSMIDEYR